MISGWFVLFFLGGTVALTLLGIGAVHFFIEYDVSFKPKSED